MIGFRFVNLLVPDDPAQFTVTGTHGVWSFNQENNFAAVKQAVEEQGQCAETYTAEHPITGNDGAIAVEGTWAELLPLCLGASYLSGRSVTVKRSLPHSELMFAQVGPKFPRERAISVAETCVNNQEEFREVIEAFLAAYHGAGTSEKISLVVHHWLDTLACWSLEDLYLSATTTLQVIAASEKRKAAIAHKLSFYEYLTAAAGRFHIPPLSHDTVKMRNDLIHDGTLSGASFVGKSAQQCNAVAADTLNWIDRYFHAALNLGPVRRVRFHQNVFNNLNAYSL